jgi:hypothetical protein
MLDSVQREREACVHRSKGLLIIDFEPASPPPVAGPDILAHLRLAG